jgi:hypothetical protein
MKINKYTITIATLVIAAIAYILLQVLNPIYSADDSVNNLLKMTVPRLIMGVAFIPALWLLCPNILKVTGNDIINKAIWCIPCFLVVIANLPLSGLISGSATIDRPDLIWLFAIYCLSVGILEEIVFRGIIFMAIAQRLNGRRNAALLSILISSAIFGLIHLANLFDGASLPQTLLQIGYSFLIGCMLSAMLIRCGNIYICIAVHSLFDFGGLMIGNLGQGAFQDIYFWIITAICGVICLIHIVLYVFKQSEQHLKILLDEKYGAD